MLIIAVIVGVSIKITKSKLDAVVSYTYYSAYSTLNDVTRSMYLDIIEERVDDEYLSYNAGVKNFKTLIADIKSDLTPKTAYFTDLLKNSIILPADAAFSGNLIKGKKDYLCKASEYFLDKNLCSGVTPDYYIPEDYIVKFKALCHNDGIAVEFPWEERASILDYNLCNGSTDIKGEIDYRCCTFDSTNNNLGCMGRNYDGTYSEGWYSSYDELYTGLGWGVPYNPPGNIPFREKYYAILDADQTAVSGKFELNDNYEGIKSRLIQLTSSPIKFSYGQCNGQTAAAIYIHHVKDGSYGKRTLYKCDVDGYDIAGEFPSDTTCVNGIGRMRVTEAALPGIIGCRAAKDYADLEDFKIGDSDIKYLNLNYGSLTGVCAFAAVKCPEGSFLRYTKNGRALKFAGCFPCDEYDSLSYSEKQRSIYNNSCGPDEPEPPIEPEEPVCDLDPSAAPCGMEFDEESCSYIDRADFSRDCPNGKIWDEEVCGCLNKIPSLPQNSNKFCKLFETYVNISSGTEICKGDAIQDGTIDFSGKKPDLTLRNGIKLYNVSNSSSPSTFEDLKRADIDESGILSDATLSVLYSQKGYLVYADIDGSNGDSVLWEDIYPFYITLDGKVIPVYDKNHPGQSGGDSKNHLEVSVLRRRAGLRGILWILKSVPFREAACRSGYVSSNTAYCQGLSIDGRCSNESKYSCKIRVIKPVSLFF